VADTASLQQLRAEVRPRLCAHDRPIFSDGGACRPPLPSRCARHRRMGGGGAAAQALHFKRFFENADSSFPDPRARAGSAEGDVLQVRASPQTRLPAKRVYSLLLSVPACSESAQEEAGVLPVSTSTGGATAGSIQRNLGDLRPI
jgi:hypothetical protein